MELKYLVCEICGEVIGQFAPEKLRLPLTGAMFLPADIPHDFPAPFPAEMEWVDLRCPMCRKRPFLEEDRVLTPEGYVMVVSPTEDIPPEGNVTVRGDGTAIVTETPPEELKEKVSFEVEQSQEPLAGTANEGYNSVGGADETSFPCQMCGRVFTKRMALVGHMKGHRGEKKE